MGDTENIQNNKNLEYLENLENNELYKYKLQNSNENILKNFLNLIMTYKKYILKNEEKSNDPFLNIFFDRGLNALMIIFVTILKRTNNLELAYYHCEKSIYYYNEFFSQIINKNNFISVNCNDAIIFLYKKTIFRLAHFNSEINNNHDDNHDDDNNNNQFKNLNICLKIIILMVKSKQSIDEINSEIPCFIFKSYKELEEVLSQYL